MKETQPPITTPDEYAGYQRRAHRISTPNVQGGNKMFFKPRAIQTS